MCWLTVLKLAFRNKPALEDVVGVLSEYGCDYEANTYDNTIEVDQEDLEMAFEVDLANHDNIVQLMDVAFDAEVEDVD